MSSTPHTDAKSLLFSAIHRYLIVRGWEQSRFVDGDCMWRDPVADRHSSHEEDTQFPTWLAMTVQWYRDSQRGKSRPKEVTDATSGRIKP